MPVLGRCGNRDDLRRVGQLVSRKHLPNEIERSFGTLLKDVHPVAVRRNRTDVAREAEVVKRCDHVLPLDLQLVNQREGHDPFGIFAPLAVNVNRTCIRSHF